MTGTETPKERLERMRTEKLVRDSDMAWMRHVCEAAVEAADSPYPEVQNWFNFEPLASLKRAIEDTEGGAA